MSDISKSTFGGTLTSGIQDIAALLPLIGTEQCEKHVGSALDRGFLYAAAAPLSIFGTPGIVKSGISVLVASITIPSVKFVRSWRLFTFSGLRWCGARVLKNAGFEPIGTVAPMIAMDGERYVAESRLLQLLDEKHIASAEHLTIKCNWAEWNISLISCTVIAVAIGAITYQFLFKDVSILSSSLCNARSLGSLFVIVSPQTLIQQRVISILKHRIIYMRMHQRLLCDLKAKNVENPELLLQSQKHFRWGSHLMAEECLSSLETFLVSQRVMTHPLSSPSPAIPPHPLQPPSPPFPHVAIQMQPHDELLNLNHAGLLTKLQEERAFLRPTLGVVISIILAWISLLFAIPAVVIGYIGAFMLVSNKNFRHPLLWLGIEGTLALVRILVWAWNPNFHERTQVTVRLTLIDEEPMVTTEKDVSCLKGILPLVPEQRFLELITRYTGPLEEFKGSGSEHISLYFTLSGRNGINHLYMTVLDTNKRMAFVLHRQEGEMVYVDASVNTDPARAGMEARMLSEISDDHPWRTDDPLLLERLSRRYEFLLRSLNRSDPEPRPPLAPLFGSVIPIFTSWTQRGIPLLSPVCSFLATSLSHWASCNVPPSSTAISLKWSLVSKLLERTPIPDGPLVLRPLTSHDKRYLRRGTERHFKTQLMEQIGSWIECGMVAMRRDMLCCISWPQGDDEIIRSKLDAVNACAAMAWQQDELSLLKASLELEELLHSRMEEDINLITGERQEEGLADYFRLDLSVGRKRRLEHEKALANVRMQGAVERGVVLAGEEWMRSRKQVSKAWEKALENGTASPPALEPIIHGSPLTKLMGEINEAMKRIEDADPDLGAHNSLEYDRSLPTATCSRFVRLSQLPRKDGLIVSKLGGPFVYDLRDCHPDVIHAVSQNQFARSVINVPKDIIPANDNLLYVSNVSGDEVAPPFIHDNRERWWTQQQSNASTFYFTPTDIDDGAWIRGSGQVARLMIFINTPARIRGNKQAACCPNSNHFIY